MKNKRWKLYSLIKWDVDVDADMDIIFKCTLAQPSLLFTLEDDFKFLHLTIMNKLGIF